MLSAIYVVEKKTLQTFFEIFLMILEKSDFSFCADIWLVGWCGGAPAGGCMGMPPQGYGPPMGQAPPMNPYGAGFPAPGQYGVPGQMLGYPPQQMPMGAYPPPQQQQPAGAYVTGAPGAYGSYPGVTGGDMFGALPPGSYPGADPYGAPPPGPQYGAAFGVAADGEAPQGNRAAPY